MDFNGFLFENLYEKQVAVYNIFFDNFKNKEQHNL
jgi:hypothetical protein